MIYNLKYKYFILTRFVLYSYDGDLIPIVGRSDSRDHFFNDGNRLIGNSYSDYEGDVFSEKTFDHMGTIISDDNFISRFLESLLDRE